MNKSNLHVFCITSLIATCTALFPGHGNPQSALDKFQNVTLEELANPPEEDWLMWRRTANHWGYSPLDQINKDNVNDLRLAWAWTMEPG